MATSSMQSHCEDPQGSMSQRRLPKIKRAPGRTSAVEWEWPACAALKTAPARSHASALPPCAVATMYIQAGLCGSRNRAPTGMERAAKLVQPWKHPLSHPGEPEQ